MSNIITLDILANRNNNEKRQDSFYVSFFSFNSNLGNYLGRQVKSVSRPSLTFDVIQHDKRNSRFTDTGKMTFDSIEITFSDDEEAITSMLLYAQIMRQKVNYRGEYDNLFGPMESPFGKFGIKVSQFNSKSEETESFILRDAFITQLRHSENIMSGDTANEMTATVEYDNIEVKIFDRFVSLKG